MNAKNVSNSGPVTKIDCNDIYIDETGNSIKTLKRFKEAWLSSSSSWNTELFQYADSDFYFYRFAIERQERSKDLLLTKILYRVMERYGISFQVPKEPDGAPFVFITEDKKHRIGYRLNHFYERQDVNQIVQNYDVDEAVIIQTTRQGKADEWILRDNEQFRREGVNLKIISLRSFFIRYFGLEEYEVFLTYLEAYLAEAKDIMGYQSIKFLSSMNLATQKLYAQKELADWDYHHYSYQIIDSNNKKIQNYLYLDSTPFPPSFLQTMENNYLSGGLFKAMVGNSEFAESFTTSEWLYHSLSGKKNFDFTSVISGYLKSVEQLLYRIVMLNVDNSCKISMSNANDVITEAISNNIIVYQLKGGKWQVVPANAKLKYKYIDLTSKQTQYMDSSIGTFEFFLRNNKHIFVDSQYAKTIADMVSCFRIECRNGFFHTHNLTDWDVVEKTRSNAIFLYYVLLGGCKIPSNKMSELGIISSDAFDNLCKKIREFKNYNVEFIFEYTDGKKLNLIYDFKNNTAEYTEEGIEHYEKLLFYSVDEFSLKAYEQLDKEIREDQKVYLTRENLPSRIFGVHRNRELEEIRYNVND